MEKADNLIQEARKKPIKDLLEFSIINLDKPSEKTSFYVSDYIRKRLNLKKTCHFGTLDPLVTGVLPIGLSRACKLSDYFLKKEKTYIGIMKVHKEISETKLKKEISYFLGKIKQTPPIKSRVLRREREREIYEFKIIEKKSKNVLFEVKCEAGTYIRKLCHDLGEKIQGAHMAELRRTKAGIFSEQDLEFLDLNELEKAIEEFEKGNEKKLRKILIPGEVICKILPLIEIKKDKAILKKLYNGYKIKQEMLKNKINLKEGERFCLFYDNVFVGVYKVINQGEFIARSEFVFVPTT
jgi:H/ACA ribonucleoprotein complex subunit 4